MECNSRALLKYQMLYYRTIRTRRNTIPCAWSCSMACLCLEKCCFEVFMLGLACSEMCCMSSSMQRLGWVNIRVRWWERQTLCDEWIFNIRIKLSFLFFALHCKWVKTDTISNPVSHLALDMSILTPSCILTPLLPHLSPAPRNSHILTFDPCIHHLPSHAHMFPMCDIHASWCLLFLHWHLTLPHPLLIPLVSV